MSEALSIGAVRGYCVRCRTKEEVRVTKVVKMDKGRLGAWGACSRCGIGMYKVVPDPEARLSGAGG
jgi:hypothetical protein